LSVGLDLTVRVGVGTGEVNNVTLALLEDTVRSVVGDVVVATNTVEDVLAELVVIGVSGVTSLEAEAVTTEEEVPLDDLGGAASEGIGEDDTTHRVATEVGTVGVHLSSPVTLQNVDLGLVDEADSLNVGRSPDPLDTGESAFRDQASAVARLGAVGDHDTLDVTDFLAVLRGTPNAEVIQAVEVSSLAERILVLGGGVANVVTVLGTTDEVGVGINLVGKVFKGEGLRGVGSSREGFLRRRSSRSFSDLGGSHSGAHNEGNEACGKSDREHLREMQKGLEGKKKGRRD